VQTAVERMGLTPNVYQGRQQVRATCSSCGKHGFVYVKSAAHGMIPELVKNKFRGIGWELDAHRKHKCPTCLGGNATLADVMPTKLKAVAVEQIPAESFTPVVSEERSMDAASFERQPSAPEVMETLPHLPMKERNRLLKRIASDPRWVVERQRIGIINPFHLKRDQIIALAKQFNIPLPESQQMLTTNETKEKESRVFLNLKEQIAVAELLKAHLKPEGENWKFDDDWSDERIAKESKTRATAMHVQTVRKSLFGNLVRGGHEHSAKNLAGNRPHEKIATLTARVEELERLYLELSERVNG
jgi:hypothetical protein